MEKEIDVAGTMRRIRERVRKAGSEDLVSSTPLNGFVPTDQQLALILTHLKAHQRGLQQKAVISESSFVSAVPIVGPLIARFRRLRNRAMLWYVRMIAQHQSSFNLAVAEYAEKSLLCSQALALHIEMLHNRLDRLSMQGARKNHLLSLVRDSEEPAESSATCLHFNELFTGDDSTQERLYSPYLRYFEGAARVLDVGCGRGAFLRLLRRERINGYGVDVDPRMVEVCQEQELDARQGDAISHLRRLGDETLGGIFAGHVIEHLSVEELVRFGRLCYRKLIPGRFLVCETPNASSLYVLSKTFFRDPTHTAPLHPETYEFLFRSSGFEYVRLVYANPVPDGLRLHKLSLGAGLELLPDAFLSSLDQNVERTNEALFGHQNVAVVARK